MTLTLTQSQLYQERDPTFDEAFNFDPETGRLTAKVKTAATMAFMEMVARPTRSATPKAVVDKVKVRAKQKAASKARVAQRMKARGKK